MREVANYVRALEQGLARVRELPISSRLIKELHTMISKPSTAIDPKLGGALIKNARQDQIAGCTLEKMVN